MIEEEISRKVTIGNFICSIVLVFHHISAWAYYSLSGITRIFVGFYNQGLCIFALGFIFLYNGYFMTMQYKRYGFSKKFIEITWKTLGRPYLLWGGIWTFIVWILSFSESWRNWGGGFVFEYSIENIVKALLLHKYDVHLWFMLQLFILGVLMPIIVAVVSNNIVCLGMIAASAVINTGGTVFNLRLFIFYIVGAWIAVKGRETILLYESKQMNRFAALLLILLIGVVAACYQYVDIPDILYLAIQIVSVACFWEVLNFFKRIRPFWFMNLSFYIYAVHNDIEWALSKFFAQIFPAQSLPYLYINVFLNFLIVMGLIYGSAKILQRKFPGAYMVLTGDRGNRI